MYRLLHCFILAFALITVFIADSANADLIVLDLKDAQMTGVRATPVRNGLEVLFKAENDWPDIRWNSPAASLWNWRQYGALEITLRNPGTEDVAFGVRIDDDRAADGSQHCLTANGQIPATALQTFYIPLSFSSANESGMKLPPPPDGSAVRTPLFCNGSVDRNHIASYHLFLPQPNKDEVLIIKSIALSERYENADVRGIVDKFGQYACGDWPGKVVDDASFQFQKASEEAALRANVADVSRDAWGGWLGGPRRASTGFFRTEKVGGKWWLVDPDGRLFLSVGMNTVEPHARTVVEGRESLFAWLPGSDSPLASEYGLMDHGFIPGKLYKGKTFDFYAANLIRKYGSGAKDGFGSLAVARLRLWGFNTLGNWSDIEIGRRYRFPYVASVGTRGTFDGVPSGGAYWKMPDPFDPAFAEAVKNGVQPIADIVKSDPACVGYFFDNELAWGRDTREIGRYGLAEGALSLDSTSAAKRAFVDLLRRRYGSIEKLNAAWEISISSWDTLSAPYKVSYPLRTAAERQDFGAYLLEYANQYFSVVSSTIHRLDPNHLYLGCRFSSFTHEAVQACAKYSDVISFNIYRWEKSRYAFAETLGKPCIVGEFHCGALDRGMFAGGLVTVGNQKERGKYYANYVETVLAEPGFVGCHWFEFIDEPTAGRSGDGENYNIGFVSIADTPYPELIGSARAANANVYAVHSRPAKR